MATRVWESAIINAPVAECWDLIRPLDFKFNPLVSRTVVEGKACPSDVGSVRTVTYKDGTTQKIKLVELSDLKRQVSWDLIESNPAIKVLSVSWTVRLRPVTMTTSTFVEWTVDFSSDAKTDVVEDAKYKAKEAFRALAAAVKKQILSENKEVTPKLVRQLSTKSSEMMNLFRKFDTNNNGVLEFDEFSLVVNKLEGKNLPETKIRSMLMEADQDASGDIDYKEFVQWVEKYKAADKLGDKKEEKKDSKEKKQ